MNINDICDKRPKPRGRPKKSMTTASVSSKNKNKKNSSSGDNEELILHLKINTKDIKNSSGDQEDNTSEADKNVFTLNAETALEKNVVTFTDMSDTDSDVKLNRIIKEKDNLIKQLRKELDEIKNSNSNRETSYHSLDLDFVNIKDGKKIVPKNLNIACWWCTYEFSGAPCFLPDKYYDGKYYVFGNFCSYNCSAAYNMSLSDYKCWDRHSLINKLHNYINNTDINVNIAPPKETLKKFGGYMTIEEYRKNAAFNNKEFRLIIPMFEYISPTIEETTRTDQNDASNKEGKLKLKRTKPLPSHSNNIIDSISKKSKTKHSFFFGE